MRTHAPVQTAEPQLGWRVVLGLAEPKAPGWDQVRGAQIKALVRLLPFICAANLCGALILVATLWSAVPRLQLLSWLAGILVLLVVIARFTEPGRGQRSEAASRSALTQAMVNAGLLGLLWAVPGGLFSGSATAEQQLAICLVAAGLAGGAALTMSSVPLAMLAFILIDGIGLAGLMVQSGATLLGLLPLAYAGCLAAGGAAVGRAFIDRAWAEISLADKKEVVSLLLREFEESSADWLWQVDSIKRLVNVSPRLAHAAGVEPAALEGVPLLRLLAGSSWDTGLFEPALKQLLDHLNARENFSDLDLPIRIGDELRWWRLSAAPRWDGQTNFLGFRGVGSDVTEQRRSAEEIARMARDDTLTGLANRRHFHDVLRKALARCQRGKERCALLLIDLDKFKPVNDTLGHPVGDKLLKLVALRLGGLLRPRDLCGRLGGDEFAIMAGEPIDPIDLEALGEAVIAALSAPFEIDGNIVRISASVGSAIGPKDGRSVEMLLRHADLALYRAKDDGRGCHRRFEPGLLARSEKRRAIEVALRDSVEQGQLHLVYQPIIATKHGDLTGFEALLRWVHPELGEVAPDDFIPIAEEARLLPRIGEWVIRHACAEAALWPRAMRLSVNVSAEQLLDPRLPAVLLSALGNAKLAPGRLELEVSERVFLRDGVAAMAALDRVQAIGVRVALDDFGTGHSALWPVRQGRFSTIKIDRSYVKAAGENKQESLATIRAVIAMAETLGVATTAEGAETSAELDLVRRLGCSQVQGFVCGEPTDAEGVRALLAAGRRWVA